MLNKREFLNRLEGCLTGLTSEERKEALGYYEEYFADAGEENEAALLLTLGSPEQVAKQIKAGLLTADEGMFTESGMSGGERALMFVLGVMAFPIILALGATLLGVALGVLGGVLGLSIAALALLVGLFAVGVALFVAGFPMLIGNPVGGMLCIAAGCLIIALFLTLFVLLWLFSGKFFPWLIQEVKSFGKYLSKKWAERKQKGETI